ncbi:hypothetical protein MMP96_23205 [Enterobacter hormaechei]|uniref:hypothetical protein n=1 Tax=Enterobacter hormaechei TaxID=158836 RepID=UPI001F4F0562|nr:hypothetical protein [Enterobacter hormaechei]MCH9331856.1 hypothetical protein [Enterobacter hormaechei]MCH9428262.1 hypothetical protein [Enterobacter hormaechei]MCU2452015.1 hypothetical protein [Enterobacter hormaechei subsp. hoffmannii]
MKFFLITVLIFLSVYGASAAEKIEADGLQAFKYTCDNGTTPINYNDGAEGIITASGVKYLHTSTTSGGASLYVGIVDPRKTLTVNFEKVNSRFTTYYDGLPLGSTYCY